MPQSTNTPHQDAMNALVHGNHGEPHTILGPHADGDDYTIFRTVQPYATDVKIRVEGKSRATSMTRIHDAGLYEARIKVSSSVPYQYKITHENVIREYSFDAFGLNGGRENCTVGHLRELGKDVDVSPRHNLGGLKAGSGDAIGKARKPVTSGEIEKMFASA